MTWLARSVSRCWHCCPACCWFPSPRPPRSILRFGKIVRNDTRLDKLVPADAQMEQLAEGFDWSEGPVWIKDGGYLLFSDIPRNSVMKWKEGEGISLFLKPSGYTGVVDYMRRAGHQRIERRRPGAARLVRARRSPRVGADQERRQAHAGRQLQRQAAQQPQRLDVQVERRPLLHRSALRPARATGTTRAASSTSAASIGCRKTAR